MTNALFRKSQALRMKPWAFSLPLSLRLALRDLRGGFAGFSIFLICIALGTGAIGAINTLSTALQQALVRDGRTLLGGDADVSLMHRQVSPEERAFLLSQGEVSEIATLRAMARKTDGDGQTLIDLKAVDQNYPLYGDFALQMSQSLDQAIRLQDSVAVDAALLEALHVKLGDKIAIGRGEFAITAIIDHEPDRLAAGPTFGSRVLMSMEALRKTGLIEPGSLVRWSYRIKQPELSAASLRQELADHFAQSGFQVRDSREPSPGLTSTIKRFSDFLTLVGLTAMLTGGIGVANAVAAFVEKRRKTIATYKTLGASQAVITRVFALEIGLLVALGLALGLGLAVGLPLLSAQALRGLVPIAIEPGFSGKALGLAVLFGALTAVPFVVWPLGRARDVRAAELFRDADPDESMRLPPWGHRLIALGAFAAMSGAAVLLSQERRIAAVTCAALLGVFILFWGIGFGLRRFARALPRPKSAPMALALANVGGPGSLTRTIALSLGAGLTLLTAVSLVDASLNEELKSRLPETAPSHFFLGIPKADLQSFQDFIAQKAQGAKLTIAPMLRGRIVSLKGVPADQIKAPANATWVLEGDRGITYSEQVPPGSTVVEGAWWPKEYQGEALVSFEADLAKSLGLKLGDTLTVNVLGRNLTAKIANFRKVKWNTVDITFIMVFSPNALSGAPFNYLGTLNWPKEQPVNLTQEQDIVNAMAPVFPTVSAIRVRDALNAFNAVFEKVMGAVRVAGSVTLIMGAIVVAGALMTAQRRRIYEAVILRTLGANRQRIVMAHLFEYLLLAGSISIVAILLGALAAYLVVTLVMGFDFNISYIALLQPSVIETIFVIALGGIGTYRVLSIKPARYLRME